MLLGLVHKDNQFDRAITGTDKLNGTLAACRIKKNPKSAKRDRHRQTAQLRYCAQIIDALEKEKEGLADEIKDAFKRDWLMPWYAGQPWIYRSRSS